MNMDQKTNSVNQCQGCQAGWPLIEHKPWPKGSKTMYFHLVVGGYKNERAFCSKARYEEPVKKPKP